MKLQIIIWAKASGFCYGGEKIEREIELEGEPETLARFDYSSPCNRAVHEAIAEFAAQQEQEQEAPQG